MTEPKDYNIDELSIDNILDTITEGGSFISQKEFLILIVEPMVSVHEDDGEIVKYSTPENPMKLRKEKTKEALYQLIKKKWYEAAKKQIKEDK